jgi:hypothetical protein
MIDVMQIKNILQLSKPIQLDLAVFVKILATSAILAKKCHFLNNFATLWAT